MIGPGWRAGVEAETRVRDLQAVERRIALKLRDSKLDAALLLLADTRHHRRFVRHHSANLANGFPIPGRRALELLRAGVPPGGSAAILV